MVMHARKQPRLNDGYHDEHESQFYQYPPRSNHLEQYHSRSSPVKSHDPSPRRVSPRYHGNKQYANRHARSERAMSPSTRKLNHQASIGSKPSQYNEAVRHSQTYDRTTRHETARDQKLQMLKSAKRVHGDWSEHVSSSGKRYFYNCKTEVSQWERPKDWPDTATALSSSKQDDKLKERSRYLNSASHKTSNNDRMQHSLSNDRYRACSDNHSNDQRASTDHPLTAEPRTIGSDHRITAVHVRNSVDYRSTNPADRHSTSSMATTAATKYSVLTSRSVDMNTRINRTSVWLQNVTADAPSDGTPPGDSDDCEAVKAREQRDSSRSVDLQYDDDSPAETDDMDISPAHTPDLGHMAGHASDSVITSTGHQKPHLSSVISSLPHLIYKLSDGSQATNQNLTQQAIQTLKKLQEAISKQVSQSSVTHASVSMSQAHTSKSTLPTDTHTSPYHTDCVTTSVRGEEDKGDTPRSERSHPGGSPMAVSTQVPSTLTSALTNAPIRPPSFALTPSLASYYNESLISHVEGWPADQIERQLSKVVEESTLGTQRCHQVCCELKAARSLVRISEIQSTLHEQRLLFLSQHVRELETSKTRPSFMST